ncbi:MAG: ABC transporter permease subunit [Synechococcaceae cyanobacterium]|nr:ABC transporter permease subunit [Synechococcaceae cyanobacterium]
MPGRKGAPATFGPLAAAALLAAALGLTPLLALAGFALLAGSGGWLQQGPAGLTPLVNTVLLVVGVGLLAGSLGTACGWLTACCRFPGRRWLRIAQLIPLATPAYLSAATWIDLGSRIGWRPHGLAWTLLALSLSTYGYVVLLAGESFASAGRRQLEAARSLGAGPWRAFGRVALPMALPAIGAALALAGMEVVNELGAVELLGVPTLSSSLLQRWQNDGDPQGAAALALMALLVVALLIGLERQLRRRSRRWSSGNGSGGQALLWDLRGGRALLAQLITALPPALALGLPLLWALLSLDQLRPEDFGELLELAVRSLGLALLAALLTVAAGLLLALAGRWLKPPLLRRCTDLASLGYAVPGAVLALGLMLLGGPLALAPLALLIWGYLERFLAVSRQGLDAALERLHPNLEEAATLLGCDRPAVLQRVLLPLLRGPLLVGGLLVFVDVVKELPLTLALRPFDFDTLAVRVYQYASDERLGAALLPSLLILLLALIAAAALVPELERSQSSG